MKMKPNTELMLSHRNYQKLETRTFSLETPCSQLETRTFQLETLYSTKRNPQIFVIFTTGLYTPTRQLRSASLNLFSVPRVNIALASRGFRHAGP